VKTTTREDLKTPTKGRYADISKGEFDNANKGEFECLFYPTCPYNQLSFLAKYD